ncbi:MAG: sugar ABC transporter permease [Clostridiaceae bacterium]|nr:sugar ABC transporter permease [Clostridiaceae bacterium]
MEIATKTGIASDIKTSKKKKRRIFTSANIMLYLMFLPVVIYYIIWAYVPMPGIALAFADFRTGGFKRWVGLENFEFIFSLPFFWKAFANTWIYIGLRYLIGFPAPIIFAILLNELRQQKFKKTVQTISTLPHFLSWVIVSGIWITLLSPSAGFINALRHAIGLEPYFYVAEFRTFPLTFQVISEWKGIGYSSIIYLAALAAIDPEMYESAVLDGAGRLRQIWYITLPGLKPTILVLFVLSFRGILNLFEPLYVFQNSANIKTTEVLDTYIYKVGLVQARYSVSTAMGLFKSTVGLFFTLLANYFSKKVTEDGRGILF